MTEPEMVNTPEQFNRGEVVASFMADIQAVDNKWANVEASGQAGFSTLRSLTAPVIVAGLATVGAAMRGGGGSTPINARVTPNFAAAPAATPETNTPDVILDAIKNTACFKGINLTDKNQIAIGKENVDFDAFIKARAHLDRSSTGSFNKKSATNLEDAIKQHADLLMANNGDNELMRYTAAQLKDRPHVLQAIVNGDMGAIVPIQVKVAVETGTTSKGANGKIHAAVRTMPVNDIGFMVFDEQAQQFVPAVSWRMACDNPNLCPHAVAVVTAPPMRVAIPEVQENVVPIQNVQVITNTSVRVEDNDTVNIHQEVHEGDTTIIIVDEEEEETPPTTTPTTVPPTTRPTHPPTTTPTTTPPTTTPTTVPPTTTPTTTPPTTTPTTTPPTTTPTTVPPTTQPTHPPTSEAPPAATIPPDHTNDTETDGYDRGEPQDEQGNAERVDETKHGDPENVDPSANGTDSPDTQNGSENVGGGDESVVSQPDETAQDNPDHNEAGGSTPPPPPAAEGSQEGTKDNSQSDEAESSTTDENAGAGSDPGFPGPTGQ